MRTGWLSQEKRRTRHSKHKDNRPPPASLMTRKVTWSRSKTTHRCTRTSHASRCGLPGPLGCRPRAARQSHSEMSKDPAARFKQRVGSAISILRLQMQSGLEGSRCSGRRLRCTDMLFKGTLAGTVGPTLRPLIPSLSACELN